MAILEKRQEQVNVRINSVLTSFDMKDPRVRTFWFLQLIGAASFAFWTVVTIRLPNVASVLSYKHVKLATPLPPFPGFEANSTGIHAILASNHAEDELQPTNSATLRSMDVWFALALIASLDAFAVVANFNRILIERFHYAVGLRMMFLAFAVSLGLWLWDNDDDNLVSKHPILSFLLAAYSYKLFGVVLNKLARPTPTTSYAYRGTLQQYSAVQAAFEVSWLRTIWLTIVTTGSGLVFAMVIPPSWSSLVPIFVAGFEAAFFSALKTIRTARYIVLSSPILQATICAFWGVKPLSNSMRLSIPPWSFITIVLAGRLTLDIHLSTMFRSTPEFQWARKEVLLSTRKVLGLCVGMYLFEVMGIKVITYIKPLAAVLFFGLSTAGFLTPAAYNVAFGRVKIARKD